MSTSSFPKGGEATNLMYALSIAAVVSGCYGDELEVNWLRVCWRKTHDGLESSSMDVTEDPVT